jgi:hypothetical protein
VYVLTGVGGVHERPESGWRRKVMVAGSSSHGWRCSSDLPTASDGSLDVIHHSEAPGEDGFLRRGFTPANRAATRRRA